MWVFYSEFTVRMWLKNLSLADIMKKNERFLQLYISFDSKMYKVLLELI